MHSHACLRPYAATRWRLESLRTYTNLSSLQYKKLPIIIKSRGVANIKSFSYETKNTMLTALHPRASFITKKGFGMSPAAQLVGQP